MLLVIRDALYFIPRHWLSVRMGTRTSCTIAGSCPPSDVRPQPTTTPSLPDGSIPGTKKKMRLVPILIDESVKRRILWQNYGSKVYYHDNLREKEE